MGARYLIELVAVLQNAGLDVVAVDGWESRARSSGGFDGDRPWAIMWHHTASDTSPENDVGYICFNSPDAPLANLYLARDGVVWVCAAGATNTNGKGQSQMMSKGVVPADSMNTHAIGIEAANNGVGQVWPQAQIDAYFAVNNAVAAAYGLQPDDCCTHQRYAPDRKIDPATSDAVQGPWQPPAVTGSGTWSLDDIREECWLRSANPTPTPGDDDMQVRLLILTDSDAQFLAETDSQGQALFITWAGPGSHAVDTAVAAHRSEAARKGHPFEQSSDLAGIYNCCAFGPIPFGDSKHIWTGSECWRWVDP
jgi:hypothetical protein